MTSGSKASLQTLDCAAALLGLKLTQKATRGRLFLLSRQREGLGAFLRGAVGTPGEDYTEVSRHSTAAPRYGSIQHRNENVARLLKMTKRRKIASLYCRPW